MSTCTDDEDPEIECVNCCTTLPVSETHECSVCSKPLCRDCIHEECEGEDE